MNGFRINEPNGNKFTLLYDKDDNKVELLDNLLLKKWEDYCNDSNLFLNDNVKNFLDRCGTFLLLGNFKNGNILAPEKEKKINYIEKPESQCSENVKNLIGGTSADENYTKERTYYDPYVGILYGKKKSNYVKKKKQKETQYNKMEKIFDKDDINTYEIKEVGYSKTFKSSIIDYVPKIIKGHKGLIDRNKDYISKWCLVDTEGNFIFEGDKYRISDDLVQYQGKVTKRSKEKYYEMDKIFCIEQDDNMYFYDMNLDKISDEYIIK